MLFNTPYLLRKLGGSGLTWEFTGGHNELYLTFDDGPEPESTAIILDILDQYGVKATFFCVGENVVKHPDIYKQVTAAGHAVGNHTYNHLNGWKTQTSAYMKNVEKCRQVVASDLYRPPYGKIKRSQRKALKDQYRIVMWTVLSRDYDANVSKEKCLEKTWKYTRPGAIIVFHNHRKALEKVKYVLPAYLQRALDEGYQFKVLGVECWVIPPCTLYPESDT